MNDDLISRQAAIDALGEEPIIWSNDNDYELGERNQWQIDKLAIETVPSAQPEIIRCKDCRYDEFCCRMIRGIGRNPDDYCSFAKRREDAETVSA